ncbi:MAG: hypothetical protein NTY83_02680 [Candidatus Micrarchaeota archaeon]|nr:hypothetical protein [Candidatus Micrarchaeota archaeon]
MGRGFAIATDFFIATTVFMMVLAYSTYTYFYYVGQFGDAEARKEAEMSAMAITDLMLKGPGNPVEWQYAPNGTTSLGLAYEPNVIDPEKLSALEAMEYNRSRELMGLGTDYHMRVRRVDGTVLMEKGTRQNESAISVKRVAVYNGSYSWVELDVYR